MRLLIMGPPGAGKGTQAHTIADHYGIPAISTGNIFREAIAKQSELGKQIKQVISEGKYVSDQLTLQVVHERLSQPDARNGWLLDGFPRTLAQVVVLDDEMAHEGMQLDAVISLTADEDAIVERLTKRAQIEGREDDNEETIRHRLRVYAKQTGPLLTVYRSRHILVEVDGMGEVAEVSKRLLAAVAAQVGR